MTEDHLLGWLSKRLGLTLIAPDLTAEGFELVGGRLLPAGQKTAALLLYEDAKGNRVSIYVTAQGEEKAKGIYKVEGGDASAVYWLDKDWGCAVVGALPQERAARRRTEGLPPASGRRWHGMTSASRMRRDGRGRRSASSSPAKKTSLESSAGPLAECHNSAQIEER